MAQPVSPSIVQAFYQAYASRDAARVAPLIADDVKWTIVGPSQILPFCGEHHGKPAVLKLFTEGFAATIHFRTIEPEVLMIDGDRAATYLKLPASCTGPAGSSRIIAGNLSASRTARSSASAPLSTASTLPSRRWAIRSIRCMSPPGPRSILEKPL